ncbi:hypothetical protein GGR52DRAFT_590918, partial [Hypoxylon sp. FL1284]
VLDKIQRLSSIRYSSREPLSVWNHHSSHCCFVRWRYVGFRPHPGFNSTPSYMMSLSHVQANDIKLYVEDMPLMRFDYDFHDAYMQAFPPSNIVSLKMKSPAAPLTTRLGSVKFLLLQAPRMETFHYSDRGQGTQFSFKGNERLPAFKDLLLRSYDWNHDAAAVRKHWDFSRLRHLSLVDVPLLNFLASVPADALRDLRTLHCEDLTTHLSDRREEATARLHALVAHIRALHSLRITCHTALFPVDAILRHAGSLRALRLRDYVGFDDEARRCPTLRAADLARLAAALARLETAELDLDARVQEPAPFLAALCAFPRLEELVLHTQTAVRVPPDGAFPRGKVDEDPDREAAARILALLVSAKQGRPWRRVAVTVGGWKPVMVRRVAGAWREWNRRGVYAERCFVLERDAGDGSVTWREEAAETTG